MRLLPLAVTGSDILVDACLRATRPLWIYTPPGYDQSSDRFPNEATYTANLERMTARIEAGDECTVPEPLSSPDE